MTFVEDPRKGATRRSILKLFGISASAVAVPATAAIVTEKVSQAAQVEGKVYDFTPPPAPPGMTYQWKRMFFTDQEPDFDYYLAIQKAGWVPVPASRHPEKYPPNGSYMIEIGGCVLMEKPTADLTPPRAMTLEEAFRFKEVKGYG